VYECVTSATGGCGGVYKVYVCDKVISGVWVGDILYCLLVRGSVFFRKLIWEEKE
jgi:hypothetical protein